MAASALTPSPGSRRTLRRSTSCAAFRLAGSVGDQAAARRSQNREADGDFRVDEVLTPTPPAICDNPALLIAAPGAHHWFAAAIPNTDDK
jgi:hypothetical protein